MEDERAVKIIKMYEIEDNKASQFMSLYQETANITYPLENQITIDKSPGTDLSVDVRDPTAIYALDDCVAGLIGTWIPGGSNFFGLRVKDQKLAEMDHIKRYLSHATRIAHEEIFDSNFLLQLHNTIKALVCFGTGNLFSEWDMNSLGLNYKDFHISLYRIKQNSKGAVDTILTKETFSARQATEEFSNPGDTVLEAAGDTKRESEKFDFIRIIRPRLNRNYLFVDNMNMPFETIVVAVKEKVIVEEGGFEELPNAVARWEKSSCEKYGRGRGVTSLSANKELQRMHKDLVECGNRWNDPTLEVIDNNIDGEVTTTPGGINHVTELNSIRGLQNQLAGNFPITREIFDMQQEIINRGFYGDIWRHFTELKGDRRVQLEIEAKLREGLKRIVSPVVRLEKELFTPVISRSVKLLIRHGRIPKPPKELVGKTFGIEYLGELAMAMRTYHARAFNQFAELVAGLDPVFPGAKDIVSIDRALPDIATAYGVKTEHLSTPEEIAQARQARAKRQQEERMLMAAQAAGKAYKDASGAAEPGSPAQQLQEAAVGA